MKAPDFLTNAAELMESRGKERDNEGERSMARCVAAFNAMTGHNLTEEDGWLFMVYLKHSRARGGSFKLDDYEDAVAYEALAAEAASGAHASILKAPSISEYVEIFGDRGAQIGQPLSSIELLNYQDFAEGRL